MTPTAVAERETTSTTERFERVPLDACYPSETNPRKTFLLDDLRASVRSQGIIEPLLLRERPKSGRQFEIVDGERRWRSARAEGLELVPALIRQYTDPQVIDIQFVTALQRSDLTPLERAEAYRKLLGAVPSKAGVEQLAARLQLRVQTVWDELLLTELVPDAKALLETGTITVDHAVLLAKLTPAQQKDLIDPNTISTSYGIAGLWEEDNSLEFDDLPKGQKAGKYDHVKPVSVSELRTYIRDHVRFDPARAAKTEPFKFEETAKVIETAVAQPGRGKKMAWITHESRVDDDAKDPSERTYGCDSWKRADGKEKSKTCESSVLGVVAAGRGQGDTFQVCINRDKCRIHFGEVIKAREKNQQLRQKGQGTKAAANEARQRAKEDAERERRQRERETWDTLRPALVEDAIAQVKGAKVLTAGQAKALLDDLFDQGAGFQPDKEVKKQLGAQWFKKLPAALLIMQVVCARDICDNYAELVERIVKPLGLDVKRAERIRDTFVAKEEPPAPTKKAAKK